MTLSIIVRLKSFELEDRKQDSNSYDDPPTITWPTLLEVFGVTWDPHFIEPMNEPQVLPAHIVPRIQEHDMLREGLKLAHINEECTSLNHVRFYKMNTLLTACFAAERLDIEGGRSLGSPPLSLSELSRRPRPLHRVRDPQRAGFGFIADGEYQYVKTMIHNRIMFGHSELDIGAIITCSDYPDRARADLGKCIMQMKGIYLLRERNGDKPIDIYGIVTSGDIFQFHRLRNGNQVHSSPVFLLTEQSLPVIWSYMRHIIHATQLIAPPPSPVPDSLPPFPGLDQFDGLGRNHWEEEKALMADKWSLDPLGMLDRANSPGIRAEIVCYEGQTEGSVTSEDTEIYDSADDDEWGSSDGYDLVGLEE